MVKRIDDLPFDDDAPEVDLTISNEDPRRAWLELTLPLAYQESMEPPAIYVGMIYMAELFCRHPEQMYAWWQFYKAETAADDNPVPINEEVIELFGIIAQDFYERGLTRPKVTH